MAVPNIIGIAKGGRAGSAGSVTVTPPAGAAGYLAFVSKASGNTAPTAPAGWTLLLGYRNDGSEAENYHFAIYTAQPGAGSLWQWSTNSPFNVMVVGYDGVPAILATAINIGTRESPGLIATEACLVARTFLSDYALYDDGNGYPSAAPLWRDTVRSDSGTWGKSIAIAHSVTTGPESVPATAWSADGYDIVGTFLIVVDAHDPGEPSDVLTISTSELTAPTSRWVKPALRISWHDGNNWGAILPTTIGHALVPNIDDMTTGTVIDSRRNSRPTTVYYNGWLGVLRGHPTESRFSSFDATSDYSAIVTDAVMPLTSVDHDASPIGMARSANGHLWAAVAESGSVKVSRSTDGGATWGPAEVVVTMNGGAGVVVLSAVGTDIIMYVTENNGTGDCRYVRRISQAAGSYAADSWVSEGLPPLPPGVSEDDHAAIDVTSDGQVVVVAKTTVNTADQLIYVLVRSASGTWSQTAVLENGPDDLGYTRPALAITDNEAFIYYGSFGAPTDLYMRSASIDDLSAWSSRTTLRTGADWSDSAAVPTSANIIADGSGAFPVLVHNRDTGQILVGSQVYMQDIPVVATLATEQFTGYVGDVADGSAIVYDCVSPANTVVIITNKEAGGGLYVVGLDGRIRSSWRPGAANSVDYRDFYGNAAWGGRILIATTDRDNNLLRYAWLDRTNKTLTSAGSTQLDWEPYGSCLYVHTDGKVYMFVTQRGSDDTSPRNMYQYELNQSNGMVSGTLVRTIPTSSVVEGLVGDDRRGYIYAAEENTGLYRYSGSPSGGLSRATIDTVGAGNLYDDVEDVALAHLPDRDALLVSSQGDNSYHIYDVETFEHVDRFTVMRPDGTSQVTGTDGLDVLLGYLGPSFPYGLVVVHDGGREPVSDNLFIDASLVFGEWRKLTVTTRITGASVSLSRLSVRGKKPIIRAAVRKNGVTIPIV